MISRQILRLVGVSARRPFVVLLLCLAIVAGGLAYAIGGFAMTTDTAALISPNVDWRRHEAAVETAFPHLTDVILVIVDGQTPELAEAATASLIKAQPLLGPLASDPSLRGVANAVSTMLTGVENGSASMVPPLTEQAVSA